MIHWMQRAADLEPVRAEGPAQLLLGDSISEPQLAADEHDDAVDNSGAGLGPEGTTDNAISDRRQARGSRRV